MKPEHKRLIKWISIIFGIILIASGIIYFGFFKNKDDQSDADTVQKSYKKPEKNTNVSHGKNDDDDDSGGFLTDNDFSIVEKYLTDMLGMNDKLLAILARLKMEGVEFLKRIKELFDIPILGNQ